MKHNGKLTWAAGDQHVLRCRVKDLTTDPTGKTDATLDGMTGKLSLSRWGQRGYFKAAALVVTCTVAGANMDGLVESGDTDDFLGLYHYQFELTDGSNGTEVVAEGDIQFVLNIAEA